MSASNAGSDGPLFQNTDEQEQIYAPEQLPNTEMPAEEIDRGGTAGSGTAAASNERAAGSGAGRANIVGAEGDQRTTPVVAIRPDVSANTPIIMPATSDDRGLNGDTSESRS